MNTPFWQFDLLENLGVFKRHGGTLGKEQELRGLLKKKEA